jgi:hypothetical protein
MMKNSGLRIRVERELREKFLETCRAQDRPGVQVIREFMRVHVAGSNQANNHVNRKRPMREERKG